MTTKINYNVTTYNDDALLRKIATAQPGNYNYGYWLMQYRKRISDNRLFYFQNREKDWANYYNLDAIYMEKKLNAVLQNRRFQ